MCLCVNLSAITCTSWYMWMCLNSCKAFIYCHNKKESANDKYIYIYIYIYIEREREREKV